METAAQRLQALKTDEETQQAVRAAAHRFKQLLDSLKPDNAKNGRPAAGRRRWRRRRGRWRRRRHPPAAQLKMLKTLQQEINERTESLRRAAPPQEELTPEQDAEVERLATTRGPWPTSSAT